MASLRDTVKQYQEELRNGIAWVAFWREGRSWKAEYFSFDLNDTLYPEDTTRLKEIRETDPAAVIVNGYYSGQLGAEMSLDELTAGVRSHYENGTNNIAGFIEAHDDRLSPEEIEKGRAIAHAAGLPFSEKPYRGDEDFDPYVFDGSMSVEDYELMHRMIAQERSGRMSEPFSILIDSRSRFETGEPGGVWLPMPTTTEQLHEAMKSVGITADNPQDFFINGFTNTEDCPFDVPLEVIQRGSMDELNYLGKLLSMQSDEDKSKFTAAVTLGERAGNLKDLINLAQNLDCYWIYPTVQSEEDYGYYLVDELGEPELPEEAKKYFMYEEYGRDAAINDGGRFTEQGYVYNNKNTFTEWYDGRDVPEEYRIMSYPQPPTRPDPSKVEMDAAATGQTATLTAEPPEPRPVIPLVLTADKPAEKLKEITDRLEQGISELFESDRYKEYLSVMSKFHNYSFNNTVLIAMQKPDASLIAGFNAWKNEFGRNVKRGEKGIRIIAPSPFKVKKEMEKIDPKTQRPIIGKDGKPVTEEKEVTIPAFKVVAVFDVSQTEGRELPNLAVDALTGDVEKYKDFFAALEKTSPVPIGFEKIEGGAHGYYHLEEERIALNEGESQLQSLKTLIHEIAHAKLHSIDLNIPLDEQPNRPDRRTREVEAESIAYTVCQHYGLDTSDYSFGYVAGWSSGKELTELKNSLETIRSTAAEIINSVDGHFAELQKAQAIQQETVTPDKPAELETLPEEQPQQSTAPEPPEATRPTNVTYYPINETAARRAKDANSFYDYKPGSATAEYRHYVDEAAELAARQKKRVDPMYHEKIDSLLDTYARKLAENMNKGYEIAGRVPSILIAGSSNFPVRKKEKQNAAADRNMEEYREIQGLLDKIRSTGMGGISADDPQAVQKLQSKLADLEKLQETMKAVNAYYRKHKTLDDCPYLSPENIEKLKAGMSSSWHLEDKPYPTWALSNNSAEIRRVKSRIADLSKKQEIGYVGWEFEGGKVEANTEANRLQIFFDEKPDEATRAELKSNGFRWSPKEGAWQRQLTDNAYYAANSIKSIQPLSGEKPTDLQRAHIRGEKAKAQEKPFTSETIYKVRANPYSDRMENRYLLQEYVTQENGMAKMGDVLYMGTPEKCRELMGRLVAGELTQGQVKELYAKAQEQPQAQEQTAEPEPPTQEAEPDKDTFTIYQLKRGDETRDFRFEPYDRLQAAGLAVDRANYDLIYTAPLAPGTSLEDIYTRFNIDHPKDFKGHSLSVSDVVVLHQNGQDTAHYVDSFGYKQVPEFVREQHKELIPDNHLTGEKITTPRGSFHFTSMSREQMEAAGYGFHHQSEDGKYLIMGNGTQAFAVAAEPPENYLKAAEQTTEQNYNMIDGQINNTLTVDELEAKVKAGEQISLTELAAAVKADREAGKEAKPEKKPSIRAQLKADKERAKKKPTKSKSQDLERS
ncbi:YodL domain-containing protein [Longicatena caecimuris]|uniref:YodL domain-containing protein n=1 Tax=Longicatena caecimuris TaxID=1796635 RepID=UPI0018AA6417|nr:YodL domain-containing protein [Longicatena caecimuris]